MPALVREADDRTSLALALVENIVRADLDPVEQARGYARLQDEFGLSHAEVATAVGRSRTAVVNATRLLGLPDEVLELLERGELSEGHGRALLQIEGQDERREAARAVVAGGLSVRQTEALARTRAAPRRAARPPRPTGSTPSSPTTRSTASTARSASRRASRPTAPAAASSCACARRRNWPASSSAWPRSTPPPERPAGRRGGGPAESFLVSSSAVRAISSVG